MIALEKHKKKPGQVVWFFLNINHLLGKSLYRFKVRHLLLNMQI